MLLVQFLAPSLQQGFGTSYVQTTTLIGFIYDVSNSALYTIYPTQKYDVFLKVPFSIAQILSVARKQLGGSYQNPNIQDPDVVFYTQILNYEPPTTLSNGIACLTTPNGYFISINFPVETSFFKRCLLCENGAPLLAETGDYITVN